MGMLSRALATKPKRKTITLDEGVYNALLEIGASRDVHIETIIDLQLLAFVRSYERGQILRPEDAMPYGQYKGSLIQDVIKVNPRYVAYLLSNSSNFRLSEEAIQLLNYVYEDDEYLEKPAKAINDD